MKKVIFTTCLIATVLMNFTSGYTSNMTATADYETPIVVEGEYTSTLEDTIEETTTPIETAPTEVQITETQNTEFVETTSTEAIDSTETTTTEIRTTEPIETTVVEETTITTVAETTATAETTTTETTTTYIVGDADENGKLNVRDAAFIAKALANKEADTLPESADYTQDNKIDVRDAAAIARHLASRYSDNEEPVVTSVSNDISASTTTSTYVAHYRPVGSCTCVTDEDTVLCPLCGIPMDCTCGLDVTTTSTSNESETTTTTVSDVNTDETTTTTAVGNDDVITTAQTAETINTLPVETTAATTNTTTTTVTESTTTTATTVITTVTEIVSSTTTPHVHNYVTETEIVEHEAEYQTRTIWNCMPEYYTGNQWMEDANVRAFDKYIPESGLGWYSRITDYDLVTWYYGDGTWDSIAKYKDLAPWNDVNSEFYIDTEYFKDSEFFISYIDKNNFTEYGLTKEQWYDVNYMQKQMLPAGIDFLGRDITGKIGIYDRWGNILPTFNPELDVLINFGADATHQPTEADDGLDSKESNFETIINKYMPVAQEKFLVNDAWTETIVHEVCECGHTK